MDDEMLQKGVLDGSPSASAGASLEGGPAPMPVRALRLADERLARVLAGEEFLLFDGAMGTQLQERGLEAGALPELLCLTDPDGIAEIHRAYVRAGADVATANTFGANARKLGGAASVKEVFSAAVACARAGGARYVAADIGPTGSLLQPLGTMTFDEAYALFAEQVAAADEAGADLFVVETMADLLEAKAALLACKEGSDLPVFVTMTFEGDGRTFLGTTPEVAAATLSALGADAVGVNCSLGPEEVAPLVMRMLPWADCPVMVQANAGLPQVKDGVTTYSVSPEAYCAALAPMIDAGVTIVGGCCGTGPAHIAGERSLLKGRVPLPRAHVVRTVFTAGEHGGPAGATVDGAPYRAVFDDFCVASSSELVTLPEGAVGVIGERINPTGKKRMKEALRSGDYDYILGEAIQQASAGAQILDVNAGLPEVDEAACLVRMVMELQGVTTCPLQIDSATTEALEAAVRVYPGKPIINSTNGKARTLAEVVPLAKHYGCALVGLTIDEEGIPSTAQGRLAVARKIVAATDEAGIPRCDVAIDCLTMAASTDQHAPAQILEAVRLVKRELPGVRCVLGVSNVSFGLPCRELLNSTFLAAAFAAGLDLAIMNPLSRRYMDVVGSWRALSGEDAGAGAYVGEYAAVDAAEKAGRTAGARAGSAAVPVLSAASQSAAPNGAPVDPQGPGGGGEAVSDPVLLAREMVLCGRRGPVAQTVERILEDHDPLFVVDEVLIPALDEVGERFERGVFFLPQLMASAEAAKEGFEAIRAHGGDAGVASKGTVVLAVVQGDIHDIGKNIVKMLLENYGYDVVDLGRDVAPSAVADAVEARGVRLVGLSALMTTTLPAMAQTVAELRRRAPDCKIVVGGAVLNKEYADMVGADFYARDASETARIASEVLG